MKMTFAEGDKDNPLLEFAEAPAGELLVNCTEQIGAAALEGLAALLAYGMEIKGDNEGGRGHDDE